MNKVMLIARRELASYFNSPVAYVVSLGFLLITGIWFFYFENFLGQGVASFEPYFSSFPFALLFTVPALTMGLWTEERKQGTGEILFSLPFREQHLILGKFLGNMLLLLIVFALSTVLPLSLFSLGEFSIGRLLVRYIGLLVLASFSVALGQLISLLSKNQITAFLSTLLLLLLLSQLNLSAFDGPLAKLVGQLSLQYHYQSFIRGILDTRDLFFFVLVTALCLYISVRTLVIQKCSSRV